MVMSAEVDEICNRRRHILKLLERWAIVVGFQTCIAFVARDRFDVAFFISLEDKIFTVVDLTL